MVRVIVVLVLNQLLGHSHSKEYYLTVMLEKNQCLNWLVQCSTVDLFSVPRSLLKDIGLNSWHVRLNISCIHPSVCFDRS